MYERRVRHTLTSSRNQPAFALALKRIDLALEYDTASNSRVVEWAETWAADQGIEVEVEPDGEEDFESDFESGEDVSFPNVVSMIRY
jgi:hypothetical protein